MAREHYRGSYETYSQGVRSGQNERIDRFLDGDDFEALLDKDPYRRWLVETLAEARMDIPPERYGCFEDDAETIIEKARALTIDTYARPEAAFDGVEGDDIEDGTASVYDIDPDFDPGLAALEIERHSPGLRVGGMGRAMIDNISGCGGIGCGGYETRAFGPATGSAVFGRSLCKRRGHNPCYRNGYLAKSANAVKKSFQAWIQNLLRTDKAYGMGADGRKRTVFVTYGFISLERDHDIANHDELVKARKEAIDLLKRLGCFRGMICWHPFRSRPGYEHETTRRGSLDYTRQSSHFHFISLTYGTRPIGWEDFVEWLGENDVPYVSVAERYDSVHDLDTDDLLQDDLRDMYLAWRAEGPVVEFKPLGGGPSALTTDAEENEKLWDMIYSKARYELEHAGYYTDTIKRPQMSVKFGKLPEKMRKEDRPPAIEPIYWDPQDPSQQMVPAYRRWQMGLDRWWPCIGDIMYDNGRKDPPRNGGIMPNGLLEIRWWHISDEDLEDLLDSDTEDYDIWAEVLADRVYKMKVRYGFISKKKKKKKNDRKGDKDG